MRIRKAVSWDHKKIIALMQQMPDFFSPETIEYAEKSIAKLWGFVACIQKDIVWYIVFWKKGKTTTKIYWMGVEKNHQGKWIGAKLFARCEQEAKTTGSKKIELLTLWDHRDYPWYENTRKFYEKMWCKKTSSYMDHGIEILTLTKKWTE